VKSSYLLLWLEAPLQSWGVDSQFGRRDSIDFPTKSGIAGLLLSALGASGEQRELLAELAPLRQTVIAYAPKTADAGPIEPPLLRDFHMVGSGYNEKDSWESLLIPRKSDGGKAVGGGVKMTFRYFIQNGFFAAIVEIPDDRKGRMEEALRCPAFDIYLGRKSCVPTDIVFRGSYDREDEAIDAAAAIAAGKELVERFRALDGEKGDEVMTLNDIPLQFGGVKKYRERRVAVVRHE